jgi:F-type H+-transporting ATPase subunit b
MHALVLAVASAVEAQAADSSGGPADLLTRFGVEWKSVIWQFISFAILAGLFYQFAIKPILAAVDERNARLAEGLKNAAATVAQLEKAKQDGAALLKQAQLDGSKLIEEARRTAKELSDRQQKEAIDRSNDLIAKAQQAIELEHKRMMQDARTEVARLVVATTQRVLAKELSEADRTRYTAAAARELVEIKS